MRRPNAANSIANRPLVFALAWFFGLIVASAVRAQPATPLPGSPGSDVVTNLQQLTELLGSSSRVIADVRLDVVVCSSSQAEIGVIAVTDKTGSEVLELGPRKIPLMAGDVVHIEGQRCLLRRRELGIEMTRAPEIENDGPHALRSVSAEVNLTAGLHAFQLDYFDVNGRYELNLDCKLPNGVVQKANQFLVNPSGSMAPASNGVGVLNAAYYEGGWLNVPDFALLQPLKTVATSDLSLNLGPRHELFGIRFTGLFSAPVEGKYTFTLESDDGSMLFLDAPDVPLTRIGHESVPSATLSSLHAPMMDSGVHKWMSIEGRVAFVSRNGRGLRFELRSQPDSIWVMVADAEGLDLARLLNSRIRVAGVGRAVTAPNREHVLGELSVTSGGDITILEDSAETVAASGSAPALVAVGQIQSLSKEEATRHLPVRIEGVVTCLAPSVYRFMSVQDETRGIFVRLPPFIESAPVVGQFCEVVGYTDAGDFAPDVVAERVNILGEGQMPTSARPTWNELINGSMDAQWVELQGLVTAAQNNNLALLLPEGELQIEVESFPESQLKSFEKAVVRIRGVLFAAWNTNRTVQVGHMLMRNVIIGVDSPAPRDPFDVALKSWSQLYQFDSRATPFQQVKIRGTAIYADSRRLFMMDNAHGIRVSLVEATNVQFGDEIEVVGYPEIGGPAPLLREAILRKTGQKNDPKPRKLEESELMQDNVDSTLVQISATLMGIHSEQDSRVLEMSAHGNLFVARMPAAAESVSLRVGSRLSLTGVYVGKATTWAEGDKPIGFELLLSSPSQLKVLSQPTWLTPQRLLIMVGLLLVVLTLAAVWISQLRWLVEQRTQQLHEEVRERELAERERVLETERSRIARDLHDDLGSSLTEIGVLAAKGQRTGSEDELATLFRAIIVKARGLVTALDVIVWAVDPEDNSLESVADYLSDFAGEYLSPCQIACRFDIPVELPSIMLDGRLRHDLLLAVKETLNNVVRHSQATEVEFRIVFKENRFQIVISDNGKGFDAEKTHEGNGLRNLPLRLSKLGGHYRIQSSPAKGTMVTIELDLSPRAKVPGAEGQS